MARVISAILAIGAAGAWLVYEHSLPGHLGPGKLLGDLSSLAIGVGIYRMARFIAAPRDAAPALPAARVH
jgi:hypothetical protein